MPFSGISSKEPLLSGSTKPLRRLLSENKLDSFKAKLRKQSDRDRDFYSVLNFILEDVTMTHRDFVKALVQEMDERGDIVDHLQFNKTPLILAATSGSLPALQLLLPENHDAPEKLAQRLKACSTNGWTALHYAVNAVCDVKSSGNAANGAGNAANGAGNAANGAGNADLLTKRMECVAFLLKRHKELKVYVGTLEQCGRSALYLAAKRGTEELVQEFLEYEHIGLDVVCSNADGTTSTPRQLIQLLFPTLVTKLALKAEDNNESLGGILIRLLQKKDGDSQAEFLRMVSAADAGDCALRLHHGDKTLVQWACVLGRTDALKELLAKASDLALQPKSAAGHHVQPLVILAATSGHKDVVEVLRKHDQKLVEERSSTRDTALIALVRNFDDRLERYQECLELLVSKDYTEFIDINATDKYGDSALHLAAICGRTHVAATLLAAGAWLGRANELKKAPLDHLSAETVKTHLDACVTSSGILGKEERKILIDYTCLRAPPPSPSLTATSQASQAATDVEAQREGTVGRREMEVLFAISQSKDEEIRQLLLHPVLHSFIDYKWAHIQNIYYINVVLYSLFVVFITWHILEIGGHPNELSPWVLGFAILSFLFLVVREVAQALIDSWRYVRDPENWLECALIACVSTVLFSHGPHKRVFASAAILFVWGELMLLLGRHPLCAVYVEMLKTVALSFLKFLGWFVCLIVAFSLCFFTLFRAEPTPPTSSNGGSNDAGNATSTGPFDGFWLSTFKTLVMMAGELNVDEVPLSDLPVLSHTVFLMFVFLVVIVLLNLLNGLAVSDTQAIKDDAELVCCASRVDMAAAIESALITWLNHFQWLNPLLSRILVSTAVFQSSTATTKAQITPYGNRTLCFVEVSNSPELEPSINPPEPPSDYCCLQLLPGQVWRNKCSRVSLEVVKRSEAVLAARVAHSEQAMEVERVAKEMEDRLAKRLDKVGSDFASVLKAALAEKTLLP